MKLNEVRCPGSIRKMAAAFPGEHQVEESCGSYEITFSAAIFKDREYEEVLIYATCDSCGHQFEVHGHVVADKVD